MEFASVTVCKLGFSSRASGVHIMQAVKVFLSGGAGSGKTVYLASLFQTLTIADNHIGLRCETSAAARGRLRSIYNRLDGDWPEGTALAETHEIPFSFFIDTAIGESFLGTKATFYDYAGGTIASSGGATNATVADRMEDIERLAAECDVVICVVDGAEVYRSLQAGARPTGALLDSIGATVDFWINSNRKRSMLRQNHYFLVTKWDLFPEADDTLRAVRDLLLGIPLVARYLAKQDENSVVRILPVSSVGRRFAVLDEISGGMVINPLAEIEPVNVDIPVACLIPDLIEAELARHAVELEAQRRAEASRRIPWWKRALHFIGDTVQQSPKLRRLIDGLGIDLADVDRIGDLLKHPAIQTEEDRQRKLAEIALKVSSQKEASAVIHQHFAQIKDGFDTRYPSSLVRGLA